MSDLPPTDPAAILKRLEDSCLSSATAVSQDTLFENAWSGVAFRVGEHHLLAHLGEVVETLPYPSLTIVPNTCAWLRGIANIRGKLLPVVDLDRYLNGVNTDVNDRTRVLVLDCRGVYSGLVVNEVFGLRHFPVEGRTDVPADIDRSLQPYVHHGFSDGKKFWGVFSLSVLAETPQFLQTAV